MQPFRRILQFILALAQLITTGLFLWTLFRLQILPTWQFALLVVTLGALWLINLYQLALKKHQPLLTSLICAALALLCTAGSLAGFYYAHTLNRFITSVTNPTTETQEYSVLVLKDSAINQIVELEHQKIGLLSSDPHLTAVEPALQATVSFTPGLYPTVDELTDALTSAEATAIVLESSRLAIFTEDEHTIIDQTRVIYTFTIDLQAATSPTDVEVTTDSFIIYISGSDSRTGISTTARSDVNIVAVVNPTQAKVLLLSIPRDYYVQLHGTTGLKDKLTHAGVYGINMSKTTIEDLLNVNIDYTVKVSFETVVGLVDYLDGIEITSDQAMTLTDLDGSTCTYVAGPQHVNGACALRFARERKSYATGDRHRGENQQQVIASIIDKLSSSPTYLTGLPQILAALQGSFETTFSAEQITAFARHQLATGASWQVESISLDGTGAMLPTYSMGANLPLYVMLPDQSTITAAQAKINAYLSLDNPKNNH